MEKHTDGINAIGSSSKDSRLRNTNAIGSFAISIPPYNKQLVFGVASTNGSFSEAPQQTGKVKMTTFQETTSKFSCFR